MLNFKSGHRLDPVDLVYKSFNKNMIQDLASGEADLRQYSLFRHDQKNSGSCCAQSVIKALEIKHVQKHGKDNFMPLSVLDLYYGARDLMDPKETNIDNGTQISLVCEVLKKFGVCKDNMWPFIETNLFSPPPILSTRESYMNKIVDNFRIDSVGQDRVDDVILNLMVGNPVVFGTAIGNNWFNYNGDPNKPIGITKFEDTKGLHAICIVGYVNGKFIIENSWSNLWGDNGFGWLTPEVLADANSYDFWVVINGSEQYAENFK